MANNLEANENKETVKVKRCRTEVYYYSCIYESEVVEIPKEDYENLDEDELIEKYFDDVDEECVRNEISNHLADEEIELCKVEDEE